ncbi:hypothetical protein J5690_07005 [bacterium]|nr:hypothetical protein [bacterium]
MDFISPYIDSEKKLHIRFEKLLSLLLSCGFSGKINVFNGGETFLVILSKGSVWTDKPFNLLGNLSKKALFKVDSAINDDIKKGLKEYDGHEFLFSVILNMPRERVLEVLKPYSTEFISIKPETSKLFFLHDDLQPFVGQKRIEIFSNLKKSYRTIYFLLISQLAVIVQATDEERAKITEKLNKSDIFSEKVATEDVETKLAASEKKTETHSEEDEIKTFLNANEHYTDVFQLFGLKGKFDEKIARREYIRIMQKIHPDRLVGVSPNTALRAKEFLQLAGECYELLRNPEVAADIGRLMAKYGPIRSKSEYAKISEYDSAMTKAVALFKIGSYEAAAKVFDIIYKNTNNPNALEQKNLALWKLAPKWNKFEKPEKYKEIKEELLKVSLVKELSFEAKYILVAIYEFFEDIPNALKVLDDILKVKPDDFDALGMKKRILYYSRLNRK